MPDNMWQGLLKFIGEYLVLPFVKSRVKFLGIQNNVGGPWSKKVGLALPWFI